MRVCRERPGWRWSDIVQHPWESAFGPVSPVRSIEIDYPERSSRVSGSNSWVVYWFVVSMIAAWICGRWFNVNF